MGPVRRRLLTGKVAPPPPYLFCKDVIPWEFLLQRAQGCENKALRGLPVEVAPERAVVTSSAIWNSSMIYFNSAIKFEAVARAFKGKQFFLDAVYLSYYPITLVWSAMEFL